jgi:hypothetical protein
METVDLPNKTSVLILSFINRQFYYILFSLEFCSFNAGVLYKNQNNLFFLVDRLSKEHVCFASSFSGFSRRFSCAVASSWRYGSDD